MATIVRAAVSRAFGEPLTIERVTLDAPGVGEVQVQLEAVAVCHSDVSYADGDWGGELPAVWGHEAVGVVVATGAEVDTSMGARVVVTLIRSCGECPRCRRGAAVACETTFPLDDHSPLTDANGFRITHAMGTSAFAEHVVVHKSQVVGIDERIPAASAALLACGVITGVGAVTNTARVEPESSVVVVGCGGVGLNVVQGAVLAEASTIVAVDVQPPKLELAKRLGATHAANPAVDDIAALVSAATNGLMADYVFVATGAPTALASAADLVGTLGATVIVGMPASGVEAHFDPGALASANQRILGSKMGTSVIARDIPALIERYHDGQLELDGLVSRTFRLDDINQAMDEVRSGQALRNVIMFEPCVRGGLT
jgi:S-(hydroxymethyl)glutathione dehydrogenase/alcohol dehydrogenase